MDGEFKESRTLPETRMEWIDHLIDEMVSSVR